MNLKTSLIFFALLLGIAQGGRNTGSITFPANIDAILEKAGWYIHSAKNGVVSILPKTEQARWNIPDLFAAAAERGRKVCEVRVSQQSVGYGAIAGGLVGFTLGIAFAGPIAVGLMGAGGLTGAAGVSSALAGLGGGSIASGGGGMALGSLLVSIGGGITGASLGSFVGAAVSYEIIYCYGL